MQKCFSLVSVILLKLLSVKYGNICAYFWGGYKMHILQMHKVSFNDFFFSSLSTHYFFFFSQNIIIFNSALESYHGVYTAISNKLYFCMFFILQTSQVALASTNRFGCTNL